MYFAISNQNRRETISIDCRVLFAPRAELKVSMRIRTNISMLGQCYLLYNSPQGANMKMFETGVFRLVAQLVSRLLLRRISIEWRQHGTIGKRQMEWFSDLKNIGCEARDEGSLKDNVTDGWHWHCKRFISLVIKSQGLKELIDLFSECYVMLLLFKFVVCRCFDVGEIDRGKVLRLNFLNTKHE